MSDNKQDNDPLERGLDKIFDDKVDHIDGENLEENLDKYLEGDSNLSSLYSASKTETATPDESFDQAILAAAKKSVRSKPVQVQRSNLKRWAVPTSVAATLLLSTSLYLSNQQQLDSLQSPAPTVPTRLLLDEQMPKNQDDGYSDSESKGAERREVNHSEAKTSGLVDNEPSNAEHLSEILMEEEVILEQDSAKTNTSSIGVNKRYEKKIDLPQPGATHYLQKPSTTGSSTDEQSTLSPPNPSSQKALAPSKVAPFSSSTVDSSTYQKDSLDSLSSGITPPLSPSQAEMKRETKQKRDQPTSAIVAPELRKEVKRARVQTPVESAAALDVQMDNGADKEKSYRDKPQEWLRSIESLIQAGNVHSANDELEAFEIRYPDYPVTDMIKKFKEMKYQ